MGTVLPDVAPGPSRYRQLVLWAQGEGPPPPLEGLDVSFLHQSFCIAGLPLRRPRDAGKSFSRADGRFSYTVSPTQVTLHDGTELLIGVPFGPKARLLTMWLATEARNPHRASCDRIIELGRIKPWLRSIGIIPYGASDKHQGSFNATKEQLVRLSASTFTMFLKAEGKELLKRVNLIDTGLFEDGDLELYAQGRIRDMKWPLAVQLTEEAQRRFQNYCVPIPTQRIAKVASNAMAIDILVFLAYQLPRLSPNAKELISWRQLIAQFGNREPPSKFRQTFEQSIRTALNAYPEANVDIRSEGLEIRYSDPAELERSFVAVVGGRCGSGGSRRARRTVAKHEACQVLPGLAEDRSRA